MGGILTVGELLIVFSLVSFVLGVLLSQRVKDYLTRTPASLRLEMISIEATLKAHTQQYIKKVMAEIRAAAGIATPIQLPAPPVVTPPSS